MSNGKDYTKKSFLLTVMVLLTLTGISFIPPITVGNTTIKRANIFSDIYDFGDEVVSDKTSENLLDKYFETLQDDNIEIAVNEIETGTEEETQWPVSVSNQLQNSANLSQSPDPDQTSAPGIPDSVKYRYITRPVVYGDSIVPIEDFSPGATMMSRFYHSMAYQTKVRPVRIAVLGDSFIEGDIITADMREMLQTRYGGSGVGFVPFSTPLSKWRVTIKHIHDGWTNHNIIKHKSLPEEYKPWFFVSGIVSVPAEGAKSSYTGTDARNYINSTNRASMLFVNRGNTLLDVTVNENRHEIFAPPSSQNVQRIEIKHPDISHLDIKLSETKGFLGYGVVLEDSIGVSVHNFAVRSNSGSALFASDYRINTQINAMMNYDLIILQYGLNAMSPDVTNYNYYRKQMVRIIEYVKKCFPSSAIVVMSVGDRSSIKGGTPTTMASVEPMICAQRQAAIETGVAFWNTFDAMGGNNSMPNFVKQNWAAKDHTHIGYPGGQYIAGQFVQDINAAVESISQQNGSMFEPILKETTPATKPLNSRPAAPSAVPAPQTTPKPAVPQNTDSRNIQDTVPASIIDNENKDSVKVDENLKLLPELLNLLERPKNSEEQNHNTDSPGTFEQPIDIEMPEYDVIIVPIENDFPDTLPQGRDTNKPTSTQITNP